MGRRGGGERIGKRKTEEEGEEELGEKDRRGGEEEESGEKENREGQKCGRRKNLLDLRFHFVMWRKKPRLPRQTPCPCLFRAWTTEGVKREDVSME